MMINFKDYVKEKELFYTNEIKKWGLFKERRFVIIQVGNIEASTRYVRNKIKDCEKIGLPVNLISLPDTIATENLLAEIKALNENPLISSYIVQLPLPTQVDEKAVIAAIDPKKDADGFSIKHVVNPATPAGFINWLADTGFNFDGKLAIVIGRSDIVGNPAYQLLRDKNMTVIQRHSHTTEEQKQALIPLADLIIVATGHRHRLTNNYKYKSSAIIIDCGINFDTAGKLCGDCDKDLPVAKQTSVPGSVGLTTRLQLRVNAIELEKLKAKPEY